MQPIVSILFILLMSLMAVQSYDMDSCGSSSHHIKLKKIEIDPHPMTIPSVAKFNLHVDISEDIDTPIKTKFTLQKKVGPFWVGVPCVDGAGSCTYDDWCVFCSTCNCPLLTGNRIMTMPMNVSSSVPAGEYKVELDLTSSTGQKGCAKITGIVVK